MTCENCEQAERERDGWMESAREFANGLEFYRGIVQQTGAHFGPAAYTSDDGSVQDSVLALKVPELVAEQQQSLTEVRGALEYIKPALPVLRTMLTVAGLTGGAEKADEMIAALAALNQPKPLIMPGSVEYRVTQAEATTRRLTEELTQAKAAVVAMAEGESQVVEGLKAEARRLREALEAARTFLRELEKDGVWQASNLLDRIDATLAATPEGQS